ncbi:MAG: hypothetical protein HY807_09930 [Nitrospirae bacterium]|nr:hypothetical protein [Nitrospirota bacterium]
MKKIILLATNGNKIFCLAWLRIGKDIYGSLTHHNVKMHRSYHKDGNTHWKDEKYNSKIENNTFNINGYSETEKATPLDHFKGRFSFLNAGARLDKDCFTNVIEYSGKKTDKLILFDTRVITGKQKFVNIYFDLIEFNSYKYLNDCIKEKNRIADRENFASDIHCFFEFKPWVVVTLLYKK